MAAPGLFLYGPSRKTWRETVSKFALSENDGGRLLVSPPLSDPLSECNYPGGITPSFYQVPSSGLTLQEHDRAMAETEEVVRCSARSFLGFMNSQELHLPPQMHSSLGSLMLNGAGDPQAPTSFSFQMKWMERNVLDYYASLWNAKWPGSEKDEESYWGYLLTMGSTEGNLHALWSARNYLSDTVMVEKGDQEALSSSINTKVPVVFFSRNTNYSLYKCCNLVNIPTFDSVGRDMYPSENPLGGEWIPGVPCTGGDSGPGTIDIDALEKLVDFFSSRGHPIVVIFNYGTTFKGSCDDVKAAGERLVSVLKNNNMYEIAFVDPKDPSKKSTRNGFWFHIDGALSAAYMPFLEMAYANGLTDTQPAPSFDFRLDFVTSIVTSGHKYMGVPWPCGIYLIRNRKKNLQEWNILYAGGMVDRTISLSRNAHSSVAMWSYISRNSYDTQVAAVLKCLQTVKYAVKRLTELQEKIGIDLWVMNTPPSLSVVFRRPNSHIVHKYSLSISNLFIESQARPMAQLYAMKHVTNELILSFLDDLTTPDAFEGILNNS